MSRIANFLMFYAGWFVCVAGAGQGELWAGPATAAVLLLAHVVFASDRVREGALILVVGAFGFGVDTLQASAWFYQFAGTSTAPWLCPPWMAALWMLFATTLNGSMAWLARRYRLAVVLGAVCGPASYLAGERLGAITLPSNPLVSLGGLAIVWAFVMPTLLCIREAVSRRDANSMRIFRRRRERLAAGRMHVVATGATLILALMLSRPAAAAEIEGVRFAEQIRSGDANLQLTCTGLLRYKVVIKAYVAALYVGNGVAADDVRADVPKRLELSYFWSIRGADFGRAGDEILERNLDEATFAALRPRLDRINAWYRDVKPGDRYALTYVPGVGTQLALNGTEIGTIEGADFAKAYFRIWLGDDPVDARMRDQLLGCRRAAADERRAAR